MKKRTDWSEKACLEKQEARQALGKAIRQVRRNVQDFGEKFPAACSQLGKYAKTENDDWTNGFFTGMIWLAYEETGEEVFKRAALGQVDSFLERVEKRVVVDHHDMGFLYSPSCVAAYKICGSQAGREAALMAADNLLCRYQEKGEFFQAWGELGATDEYRLIIDCLMNLPLLFWASEETGLKRPALFAGKHIDTALRVLIREDTSTFHTFFFDPENGQPLRGATRQGNRDDSIWARGQAWAVYGTALSYAKTGDPAYREVFGRVKDCFLNHLPDGMVPYWDFDFQEGSDQPLDSSAGAIAACGLLEMSRHVEEPERTEYVDMASRLLKALTDTCLCDEEDGINGILLHGTYCQGRKDGSLEPGADECTLWGDYFYMEGLVRLLRDWQIYW